MEPILAEGMQYLLDKHKNFHRGRLIGLFGCLDINDNEGRPIRATPAAPMNELATKFRENTMKNGLFFFNRFGFSFVFPERTTKMLSV